MTQEQSHQEQINSSNMMPSVGSNEENNASRGDTGHRSHSQFTLFMQRRFAPFFLTQFFGAFNDLVFRTAILTALTFDALTWTHLDVQFLNNLIPGLFILPFILFSATAGQFADKLDKAKLARFVKLLEIGIMLVCALGWYYHQLWILIAGVAAMGLHSTIFGPVKYAYLPQHLHRDELVGGNGLIEMGTFVGILIGEVLGAFLVTQSHGVALVAISTIVIAICGYVASYFIPASPASDPKLEINWNALSETWRNISYSKQNRPVYLSQLANSWFWFYGTLVLAQFPLYSKNFLMGDHSVMIGLLIFFSVGVGLGSVLCESLSGHKVEIGLVPFGAIGMTIFGADLYLASQAYQAASSVITATPTLVSAEGTHQLIDVWGFLQHAGSWRIGMDIALIGLFGGFYIVPLFAIIQTRCDPKHLSRTIAGTNILNALFMFAAAGMGLLMAHLGLTIPQMFLVTAILNALVTFYIFTVVQEFFMRFLAWILIHTVHKVRGVDLHHIPENGAAVLICNHVSYMDAIVLMAFSPRPIRFVMDHRIFKTPILSWVFRTSKAIPIAPAHENPFLMEKAFVDVAQALHEGDLVCIFPEGKLTRDGEMNEFKSGVMKIVERTPVPIIPIALRGLWGSMLSRDKRNLFERSFRRGPFSKLEMVVGQPISVEKLPDVTPQYLHERVKALRGEWK